MISSISTRSSNVGSMDWRPFGHITNPAGKISAPRWEILDPLVQHSGNIAVLTFHFVRAEAVKADFAGTAQRRIATGPRGGA